MIQLTRQQIGILLFVIGILFTITGKVIENSLSVSTACDIDMISRVNVNGCKWANCETKESCIHKGGCYDDMAGLNKLKSGGRRREEEGDEKLKLYIFIFSKNYFLENLKLKSHLPPPG